MSEVDVFITTTHNLPNTLLTLYMLLYFCFQVDIFSYGVMLVHVLSGEWPFPEEPVRVNQRNPNDPNDIVGVTEFNRRKEYINEIDNQHPLMHLIQLCLSNNPSHRPTSCEVHQQVSAVSAEHPASFANRVEMLERIKALGEEKEAVRIEKNNAVPDTRREKEQVSAELEEPQASMERLQHLYSIELDRAQLEVSNLKDENEHLQTMVNTKEKELEILQINHREEIEAYKQSRHQLDQQHMLHVATLENEHTNVKQAMEKHHRVQLELKASELSSKDALITSKSRTVNGLQEKLGQALETSSSSKDNLNVFSPGVKMNFNQCSAMPLDKVGRGQAVNIGKEVFVGFFNGNVLKYSITEDSWRVFPEAPVKFFRIGCLYQKILLVGGQLQSQLLSDIHEFDEATQQWVRSTSIPPMPTTRKSATAVSWTSPPALIVCGGNDENQNPMTVVDIFHSRTSQWHTVGPLPSPRDGMNHTVIHNVLYLFGGYETNAVGSYTKTVMSASIPQLLKSCLQPSQTPPVQWQSGSIPDVPHYGSTAASLGGCLLVVGGRRKKEEPTAGSLVSSVHAYCPLSSSWVCAGQLPQPLTECITVTLPTGELLVLGGRSSHEWSKTAYKCCLSVDVY